MVESRTTFDKVRNKIRQARENSVCPLVSEPINTVLIGLSLHSPHRIIDANSIHWVSTRRGHKYNNDSNVFRLYIDAPNSKTKEKDATPLIVYFFCFSQPAYEVLKKNMFDENGTCSTQLV